MGESNEVLSKGSGINIAYSGASFSDLFRFISRNGHTDDDGAQPIDKPGAGICAIKGHSYDGKGISYQVITINNSADSDVNASLLLYSLPYFQEDLNRTNSSVFSKFLENTMIGAFQLTGGKVVNEVSVKDAWQKNVTAYSISIPKSKKKPNGEEFIFATWPIDSRNLMMLISYLDQNVAKKIIETLEVKP